MSTVAVKPRREIRHPYIECKKAVCSGKPVIARTRIKVKRKVVYARGYARVG